MGRSDLPSDPDTHEAPPFWNFVSWSYLHHLTGSDVVPGRAWTKVLSLMALRIQHFEQISLTIKVEYKGDREDSVLRNSPSCKAQVLSLVWLTHRHIWPLLPLCPFPGPLTSSALPHDTHRLSSHPTVVGSWAPRPPSRVFGERPYSGLLHHHKEWPTLLVTPPLPFHSHRCCDFGSIKKQCPNYRVARAPTWREADPSRVEVFRF